MHPENAPIGSRGRLGWRVMGVIGDSAAGALDASWKESVISSIVSRYPDVAKVQIVRWEPEKIFAVMAEGLSSAEVAALDAQDMGARMTAFLEPLA